MMMVVAGTDVIILLSNPLYFNKEATVVGACYEVTDIINLKYYCLDENLVYGTSNNSLCSSVQAIAHDWWFNDRKSGHTR